MYEVILDEIACVVFGRKDKSKEPLSKPKNVILVRSRLFFYS